MTTPSSGGRSPLKIAGIALIGVGVVAGVVGLVGLGTGGGDDGTGSSPTSSAEAAPAPPASSSPVPPGGGSQQPGPGTGAPGGQGTSPLTPGAPGTPGSLGGPSAVPSPDSGSGGGQPVVQGGSAGSGGPSVGARPTVRVYNNSTIRGLAEKAADEFRAAGWTVTAVQNYPQGRIPATTVYYRQGTAEKAAADEMARRWGMRSEARFAGIQDATPGIIVIITKDFQAT